MDTYEIIFDDAIIDTIMETINNGFAIESYGDLSVDSVAFDIVDARYGAHPNIPPLSVAR